MSLAQESALIRQVPILSCLEPVSQKMLCFVSDRIAFAPGEVLFRQGESADSAYVILEGTVEIMVWTSSGSLLVNSVGEHEILGETGMFGDLPRSATAVARGRVQALRVPSDLFRSMIHSSPDAAIHLSHVLARRLANTTAQLSAVAA